jgi:hypothetical protein
MTSSRINRPHRYDHALTRNGRETEAAGGIEAPTTLPREG